MNLILVVPLRLGSVEYPLVDQGGGRAPLAIGKPRGREALVVDPAPYGPTGPAEQPADGVQPDDRAAWRVCWCVHARSIPQAAKVPPYSKLPVRSALPLTADVADGMSAFRPIASALPPEADVPGGVAESPVMTQSGHWRHEVGLCLKSGIGASLTSETYQ